MEGKTFSHFRVVEKLGEGGMGVVYKAEDLRLRRYVALKVLHPAFVRDDERRQRFVREARAAAALSHPNIATIHEIDDADGTTFIAMEYVEGRSLRARLGGQALPIGDAVRIASEVAAGLARAHQSGVVHRDLKPDNVMLASDGQTKILDFGLAKLLEPSEASDERRLAEMDTLPQRTTREGSVVGTAAYMSPEQARGKAVDARSDIFSFGIVLYEMLTGGPPFKGETVSDTISAILRDPAVPAIELNPEVPLELERILAKCLHKDPADRYQSSEHLMLDLRQLLRGSDPSHRVVAEPAVVQSAYSHAGYTSVRPASSPGASASGAPAGARGVRPLWLAIAGAVALGALALLALRVLSRGEAVAVSAVPPVERNTLAVHVIENHKQPDDPERLGQILQELLITDLSEMGGLKVFSSQRLFDLQKMLTGRESRIFDPRLATDIARQAGAETMLTGSLSRLDSRWIMTCQLVDVQTGKVEASERVDGVDLFGMVDTLTARFRDDLRLSAGIGESDGLSVRERTTASLDAYRHFLAGMDRFNDMDFERAVASFDSALAIDPTFSQAYFELALAKWWAGDGGEIARVPLERLLSGALQVSEKERKMAEAALALVDYRYDEAVPLFEKLAVEYPDDKDVWYGLGEACYHDPRGSDTDALDAFVRSIRLDPTFYLGYRHIFDIYHQRGMAREAVSLAQLLVDLDPRNLEHRRSLILEHARAGDASAADAALVQAREAFRDEADREKLLLTEAWSHVTRTSFARAEEIFRDLLKSAGPATRDDATRGLMDIHSTIGDFPTAVNLARELHARKPADLSRVSALMSVLMEDGRVGDGLKLAERAETGASTNPLARVLIRVPLAWTDRLGELRSALTDVPAGVRPPFTRALAWAGLGCGDFAAAGESLREGAADALIDRTTDDYVGMGWAALWSRDLRTAEASLLRGYALNPRSPQILAAMVELYAGAGRDREAIGHGRDMVAKFPGLPLAHGQLIGALLSAGRTASADSALLAARGQLSTPLARGLLLIGRPAPYPPGVLWRYAEAGRLERARELLREAEAALPAPDPDVLYAKGWLALLGGELGEAEKQLRRSSDAAPATSLRRSRANVALAACQLARGDADRAEKTLRADAESRIRNVPRDRMLGWVLATEERFAEAGSIAEAVLTRDPGPESHRLLAWVLVASDRDAERGKALAVEAIEMAADAREPVGRLPFAAPFEHTIGLAAMKLGRYDEAIEYLERAAVAYPDREPIRTHLAEARQRRMRSQG